MKKTLLMASVACACALAANAAYDSWFTGIGASASATNAMDATGGAWVFNVTNGEASVNASHKLEFDLDDGETIVFNADQAAAPDTNTITCVAVTGVFTPVKVSDLPSDSEMNTRGAQVGFVVGNDDGTYNYYAWVGPQAGEDSGWFAIGDEILSSAIESDTALVVEFNYSGRAGAANSVTFKVADSVIGTGAYTMTSTAGAAANAVAGMTCYGSGTLAAANGTVEIGVATVDGIKYATLTDAAAATSSATDKTITIVRTTTDSVTLPDGAKIYDPDGNASGASIAVADNATVTIKPTAAEIRNGSSGACSIPLNITPGSGSTVNIDLAGAPGKEVANLNVSGSTATFTLQTAKSVLSGATPSGGKALSSIASDATKEATLRDLLDAYAKDNYTNAYASAEAAQTAIQNALNSVPVEKNGLQLWQDYALGITPEDSIKPVTKPAGDTSTEAITLAIPAIDTAKYSGDYTVTYKVGNGTEQNNPAAIIVPLETGTKTIKAILK